MEGYYYHGIETYHGAYGYNTDTMIRILHQGLKTRKEVHKYEDEKYNHVCLYKKDNDLDYSNKKDFFKSARAGWIDHCFVFILSPDVEAVKASHKDTDLLDEWRSVGDIPPSKIKGIALPMEAIKEYLEEDLDDEEIKLDQERLKNNLEVITHIAVDRNLIIVDSDMPNFTDELDASLKQNNNTK